MTNTFLKLWSVALAGLVVAGCGAQQHAADVRAAEETNRLTVGTVQREIRKGMSAAEVAEVLGSPNIEPLLREYVTSEEILS